MTSLPDYYSRRAPVYEQKFRSADPVRQSELAAIAADLQKLFQSRRVLEVACGTGYWTQYVAAVAAHVTGVDLSRDMLALAREKRLPAERVQFLSADAFQLPTVPGTFDAGLANFFLSHVPRARLTEFLTGFHKKLGPDAIVFLADDVDAPGPGGASVARPADKDTVERRHLPDGTQHEVIKNFYPVEQLRSMLAPWSTDLRVHVANVSGGPATGRFD
ncbi:MAG: class I SAM-dependent methyltransferase [Chloroflexi bacterium]|nr:class I SAM-dependent methyltransferase [Chloroflexota bacterium]